MLTSSHQIIQRYPIIVCQDNGIRQGEFPDALFVPSVNLPLTMQNIGDLLLSKQVTREYMILDKRYFKYAMTEKRE